MNNSTSALALHWYHQLQRRLKEVTAVSLSLLGVFLWLALQAYDQDDPGWTHTSQMDQVHNITGPTGAWFADVAFTAFGYMAYVFPALCLVFAWEFIRSKRMAVSVGVLSFVGRILGFVLVLSAGSFLSETHFVPDAMMPISTGGALGRTLEHVSSALPIPAHGLTLIVLGVFLLGLTLLVRLSWFGLMELLGKITLDFLELIYSALARVAGGTARSVRPMLPKREFEHEPDASIDDHFETSVHSSRAAQHKEDLDLGDVWEDDDLPLTPQGKDVSHKKSETRSVAPQEALVEDEEGASDAGSLRAHVTPPARRQVGSSRPQPTVPSSASPPALLMDDDGLVMDWKEEPVVKLRRFVRPADLPAGSSTPSRQASAAPAPRPVPVPSISAEDDEDDAGDPPISNLPNMSLEQGWVGSGTPKKVAHEKPLTAVDDEDDFLLMDEPGRLEPEVADFSESSVPNTRANVASLAAQMIQSDRQAGQQVRPAPRSSEPLESSWESEDIFEAEQEIEPVFVEPKRAAPTPSPVRAPWDDEEENEPDFVEPARPSWGAPSSVSHRIEPVAPVPSSPPRAIEPEYQKLEEDPTDWMAEDEQDEPPFVSPRPQSVPSSSAPSQWMGGIPPLSLLDAAQEQENLYSEEAIEATSRLLEVRLKEFGVSVRVEDVYPGPVITRFEIQPAPGIKGSRISNLAKDLARSLAVPSVRVVEVIPGKTTVGIEIPNEHRQIVRLSEVLSSEVYTEASSPVTLALGHDISGQPVVADLAKMPHLLVAGTTGSGKSVGVNAMILSILLKSTPDEARLIMIDPKMLELSIYEGIPHLLCPVVTDMKEAANALRWSVAEMERRYKLMAAMGVRNLAGFNRKLKEAEEQGRPLRDPLFRPDSMEDVAPLLKPLPTIVVIVDEFADMMMIVGKKVEELIARIAQKARAAGIHLILATQRPSVDVITGLIKANIPTRIAFQVSSKIDSRTILGEGGAEQLLGHGDMLYVPSGSGQQTRVHGAFVSDDEVHRVVEAWKQRGQPDYVNEILNGFEESGSGFEGGGLGESGEGSEEDPLYDEAVRFVTESRRASISAVQRKLKIGYNRAARMIEAMEAAGVVTAMSGNGSREVIAPRPIRD